MAANILEFNSKVAILLKKLEIAFPGDILVLDARRKYNAAYSVAPNKIYDEIAPVLKDHADIIIEMNKKCDLIEFDVNSEFADFFSKLKQYIKTMDKVEKKNVLKIIMDMLVIAVK